MNCKNLDEKKTKQVIFNCTEKFYEEFTNFCEEHNANKSKLIRKLIARYMWEVDNNSTYKNFKDDLI